MRSKLRDLLTVVMFVVGAILSTAPAVAIAADKESTDVGNAGLRKFTLKYKAGDDERSREGCLWYPSVKPAERHDYGLQIGFVAPDAGVAAGSHPLILLC